MPLELIPGMERTKQLLMPGDKGFIVSLARARCSKQAITQCIKLFRKYAGQYYKEKCPELHPEDGKEDQAMDEKEETTEASKDGGDAEDQTTQDEAEPAQNDEGTQGDEAKSSKTEDRPFRDLIMFVQRELIYENCGFIASNLVHPGDFAHFIMTKLGESGKSARTTYPFRIMPVDIVCEAKPRVVEKQIIPYFESIFGVDDEPIRFSMVYRGNMGEEGYPEGHRSGAGGMTQNEAAALVRNCVWAVNPNCVHCIKYQDYAILIDVRLSPLICIGVAKEFQRLASYNTWSIRQGIDLSELDTDSEDEISDDPTLDEEEEKRRKLRIKRKRRAEKAGIALDDGDAKKSADGGDEEEGNEEGDGGEDEDDDALLEGEDANGEAEENGV